MTIPSKSKAKPCKHAISLKWPHLTPCLESSRLTSPTETNFWVTHASGNAFSFFIAQLWHFRKSKPSQIAIGSSINILSPWTPEAASSLDSCCPSFPLFLRLSPFSDCFPTPLQWEPEFRDSICHHYLDEKKYSGPQFSYKHFPFVCNVLSFLNSIVSILVKQMTY